MYRIPQIRTRNNGTWPSFLIKKNSVVCINGASGVGKTLLLDEILNLYLKDRLFRDLAISFIQQTSAIFAGTVLENISVFRSFELSRVQELMIAFKLSHISIDLVVDESGKPLSGGEIKRLIIVRALLKRPDLIIADELTSGMDLNLAQEVHAKLVEECNMVIFTSHHDSLKLESTDIIDVLP